jgi:hypothetical protein
LRNDWKNLSSTLFKHVENTLNGKESVGVLLFTNAFEENWEVVMIVELEDVNFPCDFVLRAVFD